jgi:hypothetical protein
MQKTYLQNKYLALVILGPIGHISPLKVLSATKSGATGLFVIYACVMYGFCIVYARHRPKSPHKSAVNSRAPHGEEGFPTRY